ncbi:MAG: hypothetical protein V1792_17775 [Pseudomonadota bacterium]
MNRRFLMKVRYVPVIRMWWLNVASLILSLLITIAFHTVGLAGPSVQDIEGVWVPEESAKMLRETLSPSAAKGAEVTIRSVGYPRTYELLYTNLLDGMRYQVLAFSPTKEPGVNRLHLALDHGPDAHGSPEELRVRINPGAGNMVKSIVFLDGTLASRIVDQVFVRIPARGWSRYVNRLIFSGIWIDQDGRLFSFCECGEGYGAGGKSFTYKVPFSLVTNPLDTVGDVIFVHPFNALDPEAHPMGPAQPNVSGQYKFKRVKDELRLSNFPPRSDAQNTHEIILHKK